MLIWKLIKCIFFLVVIPIMLGIPFQGLFSDKRVVFRKLFGYVNGFLFMLFVFEIICVAFTYFRWTFSSLVWIYTLCILVIMVGIQIYAVRSGKIKTSIKSMTYIIASHKEINYIRRHGIYYYIFMMFFFVLLGVQIYVAIHYSSTTWSADDASYIVYGTDAIASNYIYISDPYTGGFSIPGIKRTLQSLPIFYAYLASVIGISVPTVAHTVMNVQLIGMAYMVYYMMADQILKLQYVKGASYDYKKCERKKQENVWAFMILVAVLYIYGYYSPYSMTFRLLATIWQGKAILATVITPLLFVVMYEILNRKYHNIYGVYLLMLSISSISLSLMAVAHILLGVWLIVGISVFIQKQWRQLIYLIWSGIMPILIGFLYVKNNLY